MNAEPSNENSKLNQEETKAMMDNLAEISYQEMIVEENGKVTVILPQDALKWARLFAAEQLDPETGKQVYLNTLVVYAVHFFLERSQIETDLEGSDCWYPNPMIPSDSADLRLPDLGQIECCVVLDGQRNIEISEDAIGDRLAYVAVQFGEVLDRVVLLGAIWGQPRNSIALREFSPSKPENAIANLPIFLKGIKAIAEKRQDDDVLSKVESDLELSSPMELIGRLQRIWMLEPEPSLGESEINRTLKDLKEARRATLQESAVLSDQDTSYLTDEAVESALRQMAADLWRYLQG